MSVLPTALLPLLGCTKVKILRTSGCGFLLISLEILVSTLQVTGILLKNSWENRTWGNWLGKWMQGNRTYRCNLLLISRPFSFISSTISIPLLFTSLKLFPPLPFLSSSALELVLPRSLPSREKNLVFLTAVLERDSGALSMSSWVERWEALPFWRLGVLFMFLRSVFPLCVKIVCMRKPEYFESVKFRKAREHEYSKMWV